jgi:hypothetical protein
MKPTRPDEAQQTSLLRWRTNLIEIAWPFWELTEDDALRRLRAASHGQPFGVCDYQGCGSGAGKEGWGRQP